MAFKFFDSILNGLALDLEVLRKDSNNYSALLFQHKGIFSAQPLKFGNQDDCTEKFNAFLNLANVKNAALVLTPEYSCPWESIFWILELPERGPKIGKLWSLCCESITPAELLAFKEKYNVNNNYVYFDPTVLNNGGGGVLLDPMCYIFKGKINNEDKLIILIQFKTQHMGVWDTPLERDKYIPGKEIYVLRNSIDSIYLFTNICSEAVNFSVNPEFKNQIDNRWDENPYIILNPQMNPKPSHDSFKTFRKNVLNYDNKDIVSLNWAGGTKLAGANSILIPSSKSCLILKTNDFDFDTESRFVKNHNKGLYYTYRRQNTHVFYLNPNKEVYYLSNQKPSSSGVNVALVRRTGPEVKEVYDWDGTNMNLINNNVDDGFIDFITSIGCNDATLINTTISVIDKERLINISTGKVSLKKYDKIWFAINKLDSFQEDDSENSKRLTYVFDETGNVVRTKYVELMDNLNINILPNENLFPDSLAPFKNNCSKIMFFHKHEYDYKYNLVTNDGDKFATVALIGRNTKGEAIRTMELMQEIFDRTDQARKRVVVWYYENVNDIRYVCEELPKITDDTSKENNSII